MKKRKKLLFMAVLAGVLLAGCAGTGNQAGEGGSESADATAGTELVFAWWGNQVRNERTQAVLDLYTEQTGVKFDGQFAEWSDYWNKLATAAAGNALPDIVQMDYKYMAQYVNNGLLMDLSPYIESGVIDVTNCNEDVLNSAKMGDGIYGICNGINAPSLQYNKTLLDSAGIKVKDGMTLSEFTALCREIYEKTGYKTNIGYNSGENYIEYLLRADGEVMFQDGKLGGSEEDYVEFFNLYETGLKEGWLIEPSVFAELTIGSVEQDPFVYGSSPSTMSWCTFNYTNQLTAFQNAAGEDVEIGITTWPSDNAGQSDYLKPSQFFAISKDCKDIEEAAKVLNFLTNSKECNEILLAERGIPLSTVVSEEISPLLDASSQKVIAYLNDVVSPNSTQVNPPSAEGASEVNDLLNKLEEKVCYGQMSAAEAGAALFSEGNQIMESKK